MSTLEVNTINPQSGTTITIGGSGDTVSLGSGATQSGFGGTNTPAFEAYGSGSTQTVSDNVVTKITVYNTELYDSNNNYSSNRFTPTVAGKYYIYASAYWSTGTANDYHDGQLSIYKNGNNYSSINNNWNASGGNARAEYVGAVVDMNGSTDYVEIYMFQNTNSGNSVSVSAASTNSRFGGYKIIE